MINDVKMITDYFGFDLGDAESAVAWVRASSQTEPQLIELAGKKSLLTALGEHGELGTLIGEQAFLANSDQLYLRFKSGFLFERNSSAPLIERFAAAVLSELRKSGKLTDVDVAAFFIGCPSGWTDAQREDYRRVFERAGYKNVRIVSESRAAFMFVRESGELNVDDSALSRPTLIIDSGSSTTDFTFINELRTVRAFDFGETYLGGGLIDQMLLEVNLMRNEHRARIEEIFGLCPQYRARCELEARKVKEMYFSRRAQSNGSHFTLPCESSVKIYYERPALTVDISCSDQDMDRILHAPIAREGGLSYTDAYRKGLLTAKAQLQGSPPELILMTGGASRMDFISCIAREIFPGAKLLFGAEPEFSIARGLCYAIRVDMKTSAFLADVKALIDSDDVEGIILSKLPALFYRVAPVITEGLIEECAVGAFRRWKSGALKTLGDMSGEIRARLELSMKDGEITSKLSPVIMRWVDDIRPELELLTDPICASYQLPLTSLRLPLSLKMDEMALELQPGDIMNFTAMQTGIDLAIGTIVAAILGGGGIALLMAGPIGFIISFVIGFVASRLGTAYAKKHLSEFDIPLFLRKVFTTGSFRRQLNSKRDTLENQFADQLISLIEPRSPQIDQMILQLSRAIESQLSQMADRARLLIH